MSEHILSTIDNGILHLQFNRSDKKNAITLAMYGALADALEAANDNRAVRVVVLSGNGSSFTAGNDLADFLAASSESLEGNLQRFLRALPNCSKPVIAAVHGHAVGIGTTLLLHCDFVYADSSAMLQVPFVNLALAPEFGSSLLLPKIVGPLRANELLMLGERIDAKTACDYGLINQVVENALETATQQAARLAKQPLNSLRVTKALLQRIDKETLLTTIEAEGIEFAKCMQSPEANEAMTAFMERRAPDFSQFD